VVNRLLNPRPLDAHPPSIGDQLIRIPLRRAPTPSLNASVATALLLSNEKVARRGLE